MHHLDDQELLSYLRILKDLMHSNSELITLDGVFEKKQSKIAEFFLKHDRGNYVRDLDGYLDLLKVVFPTVKFEIRRDIFHIPYSAVIIQCSK